MAEHVFCTCWGPDLSLHDGHCCFRVSSSCPDATEEELQAQVAAVRALAEREETHDG